MSLLAYNTGSVEVTLTGFPVTVPTSSIGNLIFYNVTSYLQGNPSSSFVALENQRRSLSGSLGYVWDGVVNFNASPLSASYGIPDALRNYVTIGTVGPAGPSGSIGPSGSVGPSGSSGAVAPSKRKVGHIVSSGGTTFAGTPSTVTTYFFTERLPPNTTWWRLCLAHRNPKTIESESSAIVGWQAALGTPNATYDGYSGSVSYTGSITLPASGAFWKSDKTVPVFNSASYVAASYTVSKSGSKIFYVPNEGNVLSSLSTDPRVITSPTGSGLAGVIGMVGIEYETTDPILVTWGDSIYEGAANVGPPQGTPPGIQRTAPYLYAKSASIGYGSAAIGGLQGSQLVTPSNYFSFDLQGSRADVVYIAFGLNDLGQNQTAVQLAATLSSLIQRAWEQGAKAVWLSTVPPAPWMTGAQAAERAAINDWIRGEPLGTTLVDVCVYWASGSITTNAWAGTGSTACNSGDNTHASDYAHSILFPNLPQFPT